MNCNEAIEYIHSLEKFGIKPGLERIKALCEILGNPQNSLKIIHVAGTNGKGSTSTMISNILQKSGYNTGLFISPYVIDFRERIQYNGNMIEHNELAECVEKVKNAADILAEKEIFPTEFEAVTAAAFVYFEKKKCDYVVLEVGLGGRYDSTNLILAPYASVITSISLDHMNILGNTVEEIAAEKCGIIKFGGATVAYPFQSDGAMDVIRKSCEEKMNKLIIPDVDSLQIVSEKAEGTTAIYKNIEFNLPLTGRHMVYNAVTAIEAVKSLERLGVSVDDDSIIKGIASSAMPARIEILRTRPLIVLDGGHNEGCANALSEYIKEFIADKRIIAVCSLMQDKDYETYLKIIAPYVSTFIATQAPVPRALSAEELCLCASKYCSNSNAVANPHKAVSAALNLAEKDDVILVCGSFYLAGEIREDLINFN